MGFCFSCCRTYESIPGSGRNDGVEFQAAPGVKDDEALLNDIDFDQKFKVFQGQEVFLKFSSKRDYEKKFLWIHTKTKTIHMSTHTSKEKRHKEASLADVTDVVTSIPLKVPAAGAPAENLCLSINFKKGGGIDLLFSSQADRDQWYRVLSKLVVFLSDMKDNM